MGDYEWKQAAGKVPVQYLNSTVDFNAWRAALRRLTGSCGMSQALMYSVPADQLDSYKERLGQIVIKGDIERFTENGVIFKGKLFKGVNK